MSSPIEVDIDKAHRFAKDAHERVGQVRKYSGLPYITHPEGVAAIVATVPHTKAMLAAALLHDTVEDTDVTIEDIEREFGIEVAALVGWLTDVSVPTDGNRKVRKEKDRMHTAAAPAEAQTVKLADLIHNAPSIIENDPAFGRVFLQEKEQLLLVLTKGDKTLLEQAWSIVHVGKRKLGIV
jgi:(p)ppGpp synthase/HD superfamily hydrolase